MIRRYKRHYCTSLSDKKTVLWFPRQNIDHYTHSLCDHCNEIIRTICVAAQTSLRLFLNRILCFLNLEFPQIWTLFFLYINGYFSFVGTFITGFPFQNSLSVAFDVVEKKKKVKIFLWPSWNEYLLQPLCLSYCVFSSLLLLGSIAQCLIEVYPESKHYFKVSSSDRFFDRTRDFTRISGRCPTSSSNLIETRNGNSDSITLCCCRSSWLRIFFPACSDSPSCCAPLSSDSPV